jgi:hypothetical protein
MRRSSNYRTAFRATRKLPRACKLCVIGRRGLLLAIAVMMGILSACGGGSSNDMQSSATLSGNWQFTLAPQSDGDQKGPTFNGGLLGGFLMQNDGAASGQVVYSVTSSTSATGPCNSGSAPIAVTVSGQNVTLTAPAGSQTFTLTGTLSTNGSTMMGTYSSTAGTAPDGSVCGYAETGLSWSAISVPPLSGTIQGRFHSVGGTSTLNNQDFLVSGSLTQGENIGASNATVTGTLTFVDPTTNLSDYPCFAYASVNGQISGNSVILQIIGVNGSTVGQIGEPAGLFGTTGINPVTLESASGGHVLQGAQPTYMVATSACPGSLGNTVTAGDVGNICLALNSTTACQEPITLSPAVITFPAQPLGSLATTQTITLANNSNSALSGLTLNFSNLVDTLFSGQSDFNGLPSFTETDACGAGGTPSLGDPFALVSGQACSVTVTFAPQEGCPWLPFPSPPSISGAPPEWCPYAQSATLTVTCPASVSGCSASGDSDKSFAVPIAGAGLSAIQPSTPELDFGAEEQVSPPEASLPQMLSFTNASALPVQILGRDTCLNPQNPGAALTLPSPRQNSPVAGLQVVGNGQGSTFTIIQDLNTTPVTVRYRCDSDPGSTLANFQISSDTCTGSLLAPQASCSLQLAYVPQPKTNIQSGLDYFLELNTVQCWPAGTLPSQSNPCEIDSGRFPVELKANTPSPLRMSPAAGLDFGGQATGKTSAPMTITLLNDPNLTYPQCTAQDCSTITFVGKILVSGSYSESDDCPATLAQGSSCTLTLAFKPSGVGLNTGLVTINYSQVSNSGTVTLGNPQFVYLRGTGN